MPTMPCMMPCAICEVEITNQKTLTMNVTTSHHAEMEKLIAAHQVHQSAGEGSIVLIAWHEYDEMGVMNKQIVC